MLLSGSDIGMAKGCHMVGLCGNGADVWMSALGTIMIGILAATNVICLHKEGSNWMGTAFIKLPFTWWN